MTDYSINRTQEPNADAFLETVAQRALHLLPAEAEAFFDREWWRIRRRQIEHPTERTPEEYEAVLIGLAVMRSCARIDHETDLRMEREARARSGSTKNADRSYRLHG